MPKSQWRFGRLPLLLAAILCQSPQALARTAEERIADLERAIIEQSQRIAELEAQVEQQKAQLAGYLPGSASQANAENTRLPAATDNHAEPADVRLAVAPETAPSFAIDGLDVSGDLRMRYEQNWSDRGARNRARGVMRARLAATYAVNDVFTVGARIVTGDPDDPNTADVTLSNFADDLTVSLDRAYVTANLGAGKLSLGKIPQIFRKTDLVWDDDVNPQGASALVKVPLGSSSTLELRGLYFLIDEAALAADSDMWGVQTAFTATPSANLGLMLAAAYYDYTIGSIAGADIGDFRGNLRGPDGHYLSDFDLVDVLASAKWSGLSPRWPVTLTADYVINRGAANGEDQGIGIMAEIGQTVDRGDWHFAYSYLAADADAVLATFSHDNLALSTDYLLHAFSIDYALRRHAVLNATLYHYRAQRSALQAMTGADWLDRLRLNLVLSF